MIKDLKQIYSSNAKRMKKSVIRELLKLTADPEIISFAGGLPAPESFPVEDLKKITADVIEKNAAKAFQYGSTEGDNSLRKEITERYVKQGLKIKLENVTITTASQQALDLVSKIFVNPGDKIICGLPSYLGGLSAFSNYGAELIGIPLDDQGIDVSLLEEALQKMKESNEKPKFIYIIPDFQNPSGVTMPTERRKIVLEIAKKYDVLILEDSPYRELRFEGEQQETLYSLDNSGHVILLGTFSKIFVPGFRIGWVIADKRIIEQLVMAKQATDLCTSAFTQSIAAEYLNRGLLDINLKKIIELYRNKRVVMLDAFEKYMPTKHLDWVVPEGGLFFFVTLPEYIDAEELFLKAIKEKVAFVIGTAFFCNGEGKNTLRINFSYPSCEDIVEGVKRLAKVLRAELK